MSYKKSPFDGVIDKNVQKSRFNLSHEWKAQISLGRLYPCITMEAMPGDEWSIKSEYMFRAQSLYFPIMALITMRADTYYVPYRILWQDTHGETNRGWTNWITEFTEEEHPYLNVYMRQQNIAETGEINQLVHAYMGLPTSQDATNHYINRVNAFPFAAYIKIYDFYYSVRQLEDERSFNLTPGDNTSAFDTAWGTGTTGAYGCISGLWEKDYFTSALPTPQIGEAVQVPLVADVDSGEPAGPHMVKDYGGNAPPAGDITNAGDGNLLSGANPIYIDIQQTASVIKQLRIAEVLQSYYERIMKIGQRYSDWLKGMFGEKPYASYIDQPVMLGSAFGRLQISDVMTTAETTVGATAVQTGAYRGNANLYSNDGDTITYECKEHGIIMQILHVCPNTNYGQGVHRMWRRDVQTDYPLDMFSSIGDQEILKEEVVHDFTPGNTNNEATFGYIPRHSEMKYMNNIFVGNLLWNTNRSQHLGRIWESYLPGFDWSTIEIGVPFVHSIQNTGAGGIREVDVFRVLPIATSGNSPAQHTLFAHVFHSIYVNRALPRYAVPDLT